MNYRIGDIVLINNFKYSDGSDGSLHSFVIIDIEQGEFDIMSFEYLCFLISSKASKEKMPYNVSIKKDKTNRLQMDSHVKCDYIYEGITKDDIIMLVGSVTQEQLDKFWNVFSDYLDTLETH
jgi:hypothetical protein